MKPPAYILVLLLYMGSKYAAYADEEARATTMRTTRTTDSSESDLALIKRYIVKMDEKIDTLSADVAELSSKFEKCQIQLKEEQAQKNGEHIMKLESNIKKHIDLSMGLIIEKLDMTEEHMIGCVKDSLDIRMSMIQDGNGQISLESTASPNITTLNQITTVASLNLEKPEFTESPSDQLAEEGEDVQFECLANGNPEPTITWKKEQGQIAQGRILDDKSLKISSVKVSDEGTYICRAENSVGYIEAVARLTVNSPPTFTVTPRDKVVGVGRGVSFHCEVTGNPPPAVFWNKETSDILMFPRQDHGRFSVTDEGTLVISPVRKRDEGQYVCQALSVAGSASTNVNLEVQEVDPRTRPIINRGPQNQTLPVHGVAMLQCSASGDPPLSIRWVKNDRYLSLNDPRFTLLDSGTLQISDLRRRDTGMYTCIAGNGSGMTTKSAALIVEGQI